MGLPPEHTIDIAAALRAADVDGPIWSVNSEQLNVNVVRLGGGAAVVEHVNDELDVLLAVFEGEGELLVGGVAQPLSAGLAVVIPKGEMRGLRCTAGPLVYLTCHRRRAGLMPTWPESKTPA